ncbi:MAG: sulfatase [Bryobacterales bacterium]|nr:sulfatase [Bryobacterales bacterium]
MASLVRCTGGAGSPPNILFAISDDQSFAHTGAAGDPVVQTPAFDRVAGEGVLFSHAFCSSPSCTPSRGAILTGQDFYRLEEGMNLWSSLPAKFATYPDLLEAAGYHIGFARKGWGPGSLEAGGRSRNPAGPRYEDFGAFDRDRPEGVPFCFWFGSSDPHRAYAEGSGLASGLSLEDVRVPAFLPDVPEVRSDILDYYFEIGRFDRELGQILSFLEARGELDRTMVIVTSDNGMPFPRAKADLYDYGTRVPLAIRWPERFPGGRVVSDFVSQVDLAPTILEAAGLPQHSDMTGRSILGLLASSREGRIERARDHVVLARERHTPWRAGRVGYPMRGIRTDGHLYIRNLEPDRWPAGDPPIFGEVDPSPTKDFVRARRDSPGFERYYRAAFSKRPAEELYDLARDPAQLTNVASESSLASVKAGLAEHLDKRLLETADPRALDRPPTWEADPHYGRVTLEQRR